jgi:hypothetical protein
MAPRLPYDDDSDKPDGLSIPVSRRHACPSPRLPFSDRADNREPFDLSLPSPGIWRRTYAVTAVTALYFNVVVLVVQTFRRVPALRAMAPTESEPPFQITQLAVLLLFAAIGIHAATARLQAGLVLWFTSPRGAYK